MKKTLPLVSVIIPVFNCRLYLAEAIQSVLCQSYRSFEIIVVDDGSTDGSADTIRAFNSEIRFFHQLHSGVSAARNNGIKQANGTYIAFLDADDLWTNDKLSIQVNFLLEHSNTCYVTGKVNHFLEPGFPKPPGFREHLLENESEAPLLGTLLARRSLFEVVGGFDTGLAIAEDVDWFSRAADMKIPRAVIDRVLLRKRVHGNNISLCHQSDNRELLKTLRDSIRRKRASQNVIEEESDSGNRSNK